ncbi:MAG: hypothetical protein Q4F60_01125, partial [Candidatus Saccharibacteria bacterium]|nr:hypothetical protein [Candidatus Saccharibacteria bacterium]
GRSNDVVQKAPFSIVRSGLYYWVSGNSLDRGSGGYYWSRESNSPMAAYHLYFHSAYFNLQHTSSKIYGFTVRCVAR